MNLVTAALGAYVMVVVSPAFPMVVSDDNRRVLDHKAEYLIGLPWITEIAIVTREQYEAAQKQVYGQKAMAQVRRVR